MKGREEAVNQTALTVTGEDPTPQTKMGSTTVSDLTTMDLRIVGDHEEDTTVGLVIDRASEDLTMDLHGIDRVTEDMTMVHQGIGQVFEGMTMDQGTDQVTEHMTMSLGINQVTRAMMTDHVIDRPIEDMTMDPLGIDRDIVGTMMDLVIDRVMVGTVDTMMVPGEMTGMEIEIGGKDLAVAGIPVTETGIVAEHLIHVSCKNRGRDTIIMFCFFDSLTLDPTTECKTPTKSLSLVQLFNQHKPRLGLNSGLKQSSKPRASKKTKSISIFGFTLV